MAKLEYKAADVFKNISRLIDHLKVLNKSKTNFQIEGLEGLHTQLNKRGVKQDFWKLNAKLIFKNINKNDLNIPDEILENVNEIILEMKISLTEKGYELGSICDSIDQSDKNMYGVQLITYGKTTKDVTNYKMSWHLDKHIRSQNEDDARGKGFIHPEYHFNMGGFALTKESDFNFGSVLLIDTPRIMHPPLDIILSIDFVLKNFYGIRVKNLTDSNQYKKIISKSKDRLWRPYFISLANSWESPRFNDLQIQKNYVDIIYGDA
tara:strand:- start:3733 stop:4524 length:792 start_codon:yes stop_codon:yes gene_type:complete